MIKTFIALGLFLESYLSTASGIIAGIQLENLTFLRRNYFSHINKVIKMDSNPIHSLTLKHIYSGLEVYYFARGPNRLRVVLAHPIFDITIFRDRKIIWGTTEDNITIHFFNVIFDLDLSQRESILQNLQVNVEKITTETSYIPDSILDCFGTPKLNELFKQNKWKDQINQLITGFLNKELLIGLSEKSKLNLSSVPHLYMADSNKTMTEINKGNGTSNIYLMYPIDGTFYNIDNPNYRNTRESKPLLLPEPHLLKNVSLYLSEYSLDGLIRTQLESIGGINNRIEDSGFTVDIRWLKDRPVTSYIQMGKPIELTLWFRVDIGFMRIRNGVDSEVKAFISTKLVGNEIILDINNIDFNAGVFTGLIKMRFLNLSDKINSAVTNALKSSVHLPAIDLGFLENTMTNPRYMIKNSTLVTLESYLQLGYDSYQVKRWNS